MIGNQFPHWRVVDYRGVIMLWRFSVDDDQLITMSAETYVKGIGLLTHTEEALAEEGMSAFEAATLWLADLDGEDFEAVSQSFLSAVQAIQAQR